LGDDRTIIGRVEWPVEYRGQTKRILLYRIRLLAAFGLAPVVNGYGDPESLKKVDEIHAREMEQDNDDED